MREKLISLWWAVKYAWALHRFHKECVYVLDLPDPEIREWITRCRWNSKDLPPELLTIIDRELLFVEWAIK